jgi:lipopolysaccharide transport protein LptA
MTTATICFLRERYRQPTLSALFFLFVFAVILCFTTPQPLFAAADEEHDDLLLVADESEINPLEYSIDYIGNVVITSGATRITADKLKLYYKKDLHIADATDSSAIESFVASGNVVISTENFIANASKAVYDSRTKELVLTGEPAIVRYAAKKIESRVKTFRFKNFELDMEPGA